MNTEKQEQPQTTEPQASQVQQPLKDKAEAGRHPFAKLLVKPKVLVIAAVVILVAIAAVAVLLQTSGREEPQPQVFNKSTLERIINVSELSTFTAVYNGIARVANEKKPEKIDYYVSYEATVNAGIDFQKVVFTGIYNLSYQIRNFFFILYLGFKFISTAFNKVQLVRNR